MKLRRVLRAGFALILGLPLLAGALLFSLLYTETGSRWLFDRALKSRADMITVDEFRGRLWDSFELNVIRVDATPVVAVIDRINVQWQPSSLLDGELLVATTGFDGIDLTVTPQTSEKPKTTQTSLPAPPLPLRLQELILTRFVIHAAGRDITIDRLALGAVWDAVQFALSGFEVEAYGHRLGAAASIEVGNRPNIVASADWSGAIGGETGKASMAISGPLNELAFQTSIDATVSAEVTGNIRPLADEPSFSLQGALQTPDLGEDITLAPTHFDIEGIFPLLKLSLSSEATTPQTGTFVLSLNSELTMSSDTDDMITADIEWRAAPRRAGAEDIVGSGRVRYDGGTLRIDHATTAPYRTRISGDVALQSGEPVLDLEIGWNNIRYRLNDKSQISSRSGTVDLDGTLNDLGVAVMSELDIPPVGSMVINGAGRLVEQQLSIRELTVALLNGKISTDGVVQWSNGVGGEFRFAGHDIDLSTIRADTPSRLAFSGNGNFHADPNGVTTSIDLATMTGYLRGQAVSGSAKIQTKPDTIVFERARFIAGKNRIELHGSWADQMNGGFNLKLDDLSVFDSRLGGKIAGAGTFSGQPKLPRINAKLKGTALHLDRIKADALAISIDVDAARSDESTAVFSINSLSLDGKPLGELVVNGRGNAQAHTVHLDLNGDALTVTTAVSGVWEESSWRGSFNAMTLKSDIAGTWSLLKASDLAYARGVLSLSEACFESDPARVCIAGEQRGGGSNAMLSLAALPLSLADHFLPTTLKLNGVAAGSAELRAAEGVVTGSGQIKVADGSIERNRGPGNLDTVSINAFALEFDLSPDNVRAKVNADVEQWFVLQGQLNAQRTAGGAIIGVVNAQSSNISWIEEFVPELDGSNGEITLTSAINGSFDEPEAEVHARLLNGAMRVPDIGLEVTKIEANVIGDSRSITVDAQLGALEGTLALTGVASLDDEKRWRYDLRLDGSNFPIVRIPEAEADVSPTLRLEGDAEFLHVAGTLLVPRVFIDVKRLPNSAVKVSGDQIIVAADGSVPVESTNGNFLTDRVSGDVAIRLGDDISINGFGLSSRLSGGVDWTKKQGSELGRANGKVLIDTGVFKAYGQHMQIEDGRLEFAGPVDNPNLNLRAVRPDLPVKAGVVVTGTVRTPKISLFSEPPQSDANTLSYIVTGRALDDAAAGDAALLTQAALSLGVAESAMVTNQIRNTFGLDEFSIAAGKTSRETSLVAGKRLSPKLSVRSGFNPFDQLWSFFLNYKLTDRWSIEAESGERQGADLLYSIERERLIDALMPFD